jgi:2-methylcitrate dehydratase PrpD
MALDDKAHQERAIADGLKQLTGWTAALEWADIPVMVRGRAAIVLADNLSATIAARDEPEVVAFHDGLVSSSGSAESTVFNGRDHLLDRYSAALANGGVSDWCELDEGYRKTLCHAGIYCIPALLAEAEAGSATTQNLLRALVIGYESITRIARTFTDPSLTLHTHGSLAAVGAAASIAALRRLSGHEAAQAISTAATLVVPGPYNHAVKGAMVRNVWPGVGAWSGMRAVDWSGIGITGAPESLYDVFASALGATVQAGELTDSLGQNWGIADGYHKLYACCQYGHSAVEASLQLRERLPRGQQASAIRGIHIDTHWRGRTIDNEAPATTLAAKFSMQHILAAITHFGHAGAEAFHVSTLTDPAVATLRERVTIGSYDPEPEWPNDRPAKVTWELEDGSKLTEEVLSARGGPDRPFLPEEIKAKVSGIVDPVYPDMFGVLSRLMTLNDDVIRLPWSTLVHQMGVRPTA